MGSKSGARPHRGAFEGCPPELPGRPLEARGDARPRGMTAASREATRTKNRTRLTSSATTPGESRACRFHSRGSRERTLPSLVRTRIGRSPHCGLARAGAILPTPEWLAVRPHYEVRRPLAKLRSGAVILVGGARWGPLPRLAAVPQHDFPSSFHLGADQDAPAAAQPRPRGAPRWRPSSECQLPLPRPPL